jgi:hypothetical protein
MFFMRQHYVTNRRNLTDIQKIIKEQYNMEVTPQTLYNWCKKFDLLKFRGKGRRLKQPRQFAKSPMQLRMEKERRERRRMNQLAKKSTTSKPPPRKKSP